MPDVAELRKRMLALQDALSAYVDVGMSWLGTGMVRQGADHIIWHCSTVMPREQWKRIVVTWKQLEEADAVLAREPASETPGALTERIDALVHAVQPFVDVSFAYLLYAVKEPTVIWCGPWSDPTRPQVSVAHARKALRLVPLTRGLFEQELWTEAIV